MLVLLERSANIKLQFHRQFLSKDKFSSKSKLLNLLRVLPVQVKALVLERDELDFDGVCKLYVDVNRAFFHQEI